MTQNKQIIEHLESGKSITTWEAIQIYHITRLASRISELCKQGYNIVSDRVKSNGKTYSRYYLYSK